MYLRLHFGRGLEIRENLTQGTLGHSRFEWELMKWYTNRCYCQSCRGYIQFSTCWCWKSISQVFRMYFSLRQLGLARLWPMRIIQWWWWIDKFVNSAPKISRQWKLCGVIAQQRTVRRRLKRWCGWRIHNFLSLDLYSLFIKFEDEFL